MYQLFLHLLHSLYKQQLAHQAALFNQFGQGQAGAAAGANYGGAGGGGFGGAPGNGAAGAGGFYAPNFAGSSAAYGPGGFQQSATIIPANPVRGESRLVSLEYISIYSVPLLYYRYPELPER